MSLLTVEDVNTYYGKVQILRDVSLNIDRDEAVALIGNNGAGKTTLYRSILMLTPPRSGSITFDGEALTEKQPFEIARLGVGFLPAERGMFNNLTVRGSIDIFLDHSDSSHDEILNLFPALESDYENKCANISGGQQRMVGLARIIALEPDIILLDEPVEGLAPFIIEDIEEMIANIRDRGVSIVVAEHNLNFVKNVTDRAYIIERGEVVWEGEMAELDENPELMELYLSI